MEKLVSWYEIGYRLEQHCRHGLCGKEHPAFGIVLATGAKREQEKRMSKTTVAVLAAVVGLSALAGCQQRRQEEFTMVEPMPQPIYVEPISQKYH